MSKSRVLNIYWVDSVLHFSFYVLIMADTYLSYTINERIRTLEARIYRQTLTGFSPFPPNPLK